MPTRSNFSKSDRPVWARLFPRLVRLVVLAAAALVVHAANERPRPPDRVTLTDAQTFFPSAAQLAGGDRRLGGQTVFDEHGRPLGLVLTTSPHTDDIIGYAGPSNLLIALDSQQRVIGVRLLTSGDTQAHVNEMRTSGSYWKQFVGWQSDQRTRHAEAVSGSTLTSLAMAEAIERRLGGSVTSLRFPDPVTLTEAQSLIGSAASLKADDPRPGWNRVLDQQGKSVGFAVRTSPYTDNGRGYKGPTESLVAIAADGQTVAGLIIRRSYDTPEYVERVKDDEEFIRLLTGRTIDQWANIDFARAGIEGVSGATQTSFAVADGLQRRFAADQAATKAAERSRTWNPGLLAVIVGGLAIAFTPLRTSRRVRALWQGILIVVFLFWLGDLLSLALLAGWSRHGVPWDTAPTTVLLVAVALVVPWATRRQIYCQQLCPHGAAQAWLGRVKKLHVRMPLSLHRWLTRLPAVLLAAGLCLGIFWLNFDLAWLEPFDGWVLKSAAAASAIIALVGLAASVFVPQAYCRYGCPTGELLRLIKSGGHHDHLGGRDLAAGSLVAIAAAAIFLPRLIERPVKLPGESRAAEVAQFSGQAFGTTWSVKLRGTHDPVALKEAVAEELRRIENTLSHWQPDSFTSQFNASETTFATEQPAELITLVSRAQELSRLTGGAYDITVAPLVDAWGFGPSGDKTTPPTDQQIDILLARTGWQKLIVDTDSNTLRKTHPQLKIDPGSMLQGYAADRVASILDEAGIQEFLVEVGGELFARGSWQVAIEDPRDPSRQSRVLALTNAGLATSGFYRATKQLDSTPAHHLISTHSGRPIEATAALSAVIAPTALEADAWATALLILGLPDGLRLAERENIAAFLLGIDGQPKITPQGENFFATDSVPKN